MTTDPKIQMLAKVGWNEWWLVGKRGSRDSAEEMLTFWWWVWHSNFVCLKQQYCKYPYFKALCLSKIMNKLRQTRTSKLSSII